ncbi:FHA domain-containing protein [Pseudoclavibacter helvolus]|uniref:FHA domain-containing protein n=1 Tax=Pseudoclavibacter helvolus TaxID=255205 RepID=UPI003C743838
MPEAGSDPDRLGRAAQPQGDPRADDWLRAELDDEYPLPPMPAPRQATPAPGAAPAVPHAPHAPQPAQHDPSADIEPPLPEWVIVLSDGVSLPIYGPVVIGRNPSQERFPDASVSAVADRTQTMSKTHARFWADGDRLYVDDLNSTNGVALFPGGNAHGALAVEPGVPAELRSGDVVQLGEYRLSIRRS